MATHSSVLAWRSHGQRSLAGSSPGDCKAGHDGHELEQAPGVGDGQGSLVCCGPWGHKESDTTELN